MTDRYLDKVYDAEGREAIQNLYDKWSGSYDAELAENGYATPARIARALGGVVADKSTPILDYGCGTGMSGLALSGEGFRTIDGMDPSEGMLAQSRAKGLYRSLLLLDLDAPLPIRDGQYRVILAVGVISTGAGPASLMDTLIALVPRGGHFAFSLNHHALEDPDYVAGVTRLKEAGHRPVVEEYGTHIEKIGAKSMVYIFERA